MKVRSLMNEEGKPNRKTFIDGIEVNYGDEIEISKGFQKSQAFKNMMKQNYIEEVIEDENEDN